MQDEILLRLSREECSDIMELSESYQNRFYGTEPDVAERFVRLDVLEQKIDEATKPVPKDLLVKLDHIDVCIMQSAMMCGTLVFLLRHCESDLIERVESFERFFLRAAALGEPIVITKELKMTREKRNATEILTDEDLDLFTESLSQWVTKNIGEASPERIERARELELLFMYARVNYGKQKTVIEEHVP